MTKRTYVQIMQSEIDALKAERDQARRWLQWVIDIARAGDAATLASTTDAADNWLHRDELAAEYGPEVAACADALDTAALGWAGAGAEASDDDALAQMREAGK